MNQSARLGAKSIILAAVNMLDETEQMRRGTAVKLTEPQLDAYDRDGYLRFPGLLSAAEVASLRTEVARLAGVDDPCVVREGLSGSAKSMFRLHETDGATASAPFRALSRSPRALGLAQQVLHDDALYLHHSKVNMKAAIEGSVWPWHQDYGSWQKDGIRAPRMATLMVMLDDATPFAGCLHFLPGSHQSGRIEPFRDTSTAYKLWAVPHEEVHGMLAEGPEPVAITGQAGDAALFHCLLVHASGHNLSRHNRWQAYFCYNTVENRPQPVPDPRPDYVRSRNWVPMEVARDSTILTGADG